MDSIKETNKRLDISKKISSSLEGIIKGILLGGSMGFGQNISVNKKSDIDMVIVCDKNKINELNSAIYFQGEIEEETLKMFKEGTINFFWVTKMVNDVEVNSFIYETKNYTKFCLMEGGLKGYKLGRPQEIQENYGFDGSLIKFKRNVTPHNEGFIYEKPPLAGGKFFGAPPRDDFTRGTYILYQENNFFDELKEQVWDAIIERLILEHGAKLDLKKTNILESEFVYKARPGK